ncbi:MAG: HNH endonuclease [Rhodomicrobium sp.]
MSHQNTMLSCAICEEEITAQNDSNEHVILGALGGRLEVSGFICRRCNNTSGNKWDAALASQLHPLIILFGVKRQKGTTPALPIITTAGENLIMNPTGGFNVTPSHSEEITPEGTKLHIAARSQKELKRMLRGFKRKYPKLDIDRALTEAKDTKTYPKGMVQLQNELGGEASGRSIVKSVLALTHHAGISINLCGDALHYLRDSASPPSFGYNYASDLVGNRPTSVPLHCVSVEANPRTGLILGYAEYFAIHRVVVCLGRGYTGNPINMTYAIDPRSGERLNLTIRLGFCESEIEAIYDYQMMRDGAIEEIFDKLMPSVMERQFEREKDRAIKEAVRHAFANCGAQLGEILTEEQKKKLPGLVWESLKPFLLHHMVRQQPEQTHSD